MAEQNQNNVDRRVGSRNGVVMSRSADKTIKVNLTSLVKHPRYGKYVRHSTKVSVHDPRNEAREGDLVEIVPCRRMSKSKSWRLARVTRRSDGPVQNTNG